MKNVKLAFMLVVAVVVMQVATTAIASTYHHAINGITCRAANLRQAQELGWDHARISNNGTRDLWVVCSVDRAKDYVLDSGSTNDYMYSDDAYVFIWFDSTASATAEATCIARSMSLSVTDGAATDATSQTLTNPGGAPVVNSMHFDIDAWGKTTPITVTCLLPPHTGINGIQLSPQAYQP